MPRVLAEYFRITLALVTGAVLCAIMAWRGMAALERLRPPDPVEVALAPEWISHPLTVNTGGTFSLDLELDATGAVPCGQGTECVLPASQGTLEWRIVDAGRQVIAHGRPGRDGHRVRAGTFLWLELGEAPLPAGRHRLLLRMPVAVAGAGNEARVRFWRGARADGARHNAEAQRVSAWTVGAVLLAFLALLSGLLERTLWQRRRARP